jgi:hypothetical protein
MKPTHSTFGAMSLRRVALHIRKIVLLPMLALLSGPTFGAFHLWKINELYSNADGSVQFIELLATTGSQQFIAAHSITISGPGGSRSFTCSTNLPSDSANKTFIIGTSNLASIPGGVTPNYVFTNSVPFLFTGSGTTTVNWDGFDIVTYTNLPTNGSGSLVRSGSVMVVSATNSPKNFTGASNSIVPVKFQPASLNGTTATGTNGTAGPNYAVEKRDNLTVTNWITISNVTGNGASKTVNIPATAPQGLYRLRVP